MKRGGPLKRRKGLKADPASTRRWQQESRERARERELERVVEQTRPKPRRREARRNPNAVGWTQRVFTLYGRYCRRCSTRRAPVRAVQAHHAIPRQVIANDPRKGQQERDALEYDARNGVPLCRRCHDDSPSSRLRRAQLPAGVIEWAIDHGYGDRLDRIYGRRGAR